MSYRQYYCNYSKALRWIFHCFKNSLEEACFQDSEFENYGCGATLEIKFFDQDATNNNNQDISERGHIKYYSSSEDLYEQVKEFIAQALNKWMNNEFKNLKGKNNSWDPENTNHYIEATLWIMCTLDNETIIKGECNQRIACENLNEEINEGFKKECLTISSLNNNYNFEKDSVTARDIQSILDSYSECSVIFIEDDKIWNKCFKIENGEFKDKVISLVLKNHGGEHEYNINELRNELQRNYSKCQEDLWQFHERMMREDNINLEGTTYYWLECQMNIIDFITKKLREIVSQSKEEGEYLCQNVHYIG